MASLQDKYDSWIFITPIDGLKLSEETNEEIKINRVTFVSKRKLPRIRKRLGIPVTIPKLEKVDFHKDKDSPLRLKNFLTSSETYAVLPFKGNPKDKESDCIRIINDELNIISLSQLVWSTRRFNRRIKIKTSDKGSFYRKISINKRIKEFTLGFKRTDNPAPLVLEKNWFDFQKRFFFFDLIKIITGKITISKKWRTTLNRVAIFVGQSQNSNDIPSCFIWNIIALEMLLTNSEDKIVEALVQRAEYFLGWNEQWEKDNYELRIREIYKKRCDFIHEGDKKHITIKDLLFTDDLIFNILNNIVRCSNIIKDRKDIIDYSQKYEAEKLLKLKSKFRLGKFEIMRNHYTEEDYKRI
jgi:hypothetical protein